MTTITSNASSSASASVETSGWTLKDPLDATRNLLGIWIRPISLTSPETTEVVHALGRANAIVRSDSVVSGVEGKLEITVLESGWVALRTVIYSQRTLLLQSPRGDQWYIRLLERTKEIGTVPGQRTIEASFVEVDAP